MPFGGEYSDDDKFLLIDCVKAHPVIWNVANKFYKSKDKYGEWKKVVEDMMDVTGREFTVEGVKIQWQSLRRQFSNTKKRKKTGNGIKPVWRFWTPMLFIECADVDVEREEEMKEQPMPSTSKSGQNKKQKFDPELEFVDHLPCLGDKEIGPHALMVQQMIQRLAKYRREQFEFKKAIVGIVQEFEGWLIDNELGTEIGEDE